MKPLQTWLKNPTHFTLLLLSLLPIFFLWVYIDTYGRNYPVNDSWLDALDIASEVQEGTLELSDITDERYGHRFIFTNALTAFLSYANDWQVVYELYVIFALALMRFLFIVLIFHTLRPEWTHLALIPFSLLVFATYQYLIWLSGAYSVWNFGSFFALALIWVLVAFPVSYRALTAALVLGVCATYTNGSGLIVLPVMTITLWMYGYRKIGHYALWIGAMLPAILFYFGGSSISTSGEADASLNLSNITDIDAAWRFIIMVVGSPFSYALNENVPYRVGVLGVLILVANFVYLWLVQKNTRLLAPWMSLAGFGGGVAVMLFLSRYQEDRFILAIEQRYALPSTHLWLAVVATGLLVLFYARQRRGTVHYALMAANMLLLLVMSATYLQANAWNMQATARRFDLAIGEPFEPPDITCLRHFPMSYDTICKQNLLPLADADDADIFRLAYYDLALFDSQSPQNLLPDAAQGDDAVLLETSNPWRNAYLQRWWLADGVSDHIFHLAAQPQDDLLTPPNPISHEATLSDASLAQMTALSDTIWHVIAIDRADNNSSITTAFDAAGYMPTVITDNPQLGRYEDAFVIIRYEKVPKSLAEIAVFDELFTLQAWRWVGEPVACEPATLQTWWSATLVPDALYGLTLSLLDADSKPLANTASGLTSVSPPLWQVGQLYLDERQILLPCEGNIKVGIAVFLNDVASRLSIQSPAGIVENEFFILIDKE